MRYAISLITILLAAAAAPAQGRDTAAAARALSAADQQWLTRETTVWQAVKDKKPDTFAAFLAPNYQSVVADGVHDKAADVASVPQVNLRSFQLSDFKVRRVAPQTVVLTYKVVVEGDAGGTDFSGAYWNSSVWRQTGGRWRAILHTEAKAP